MSMWAELCELSVPSMFVNVLLFTVAGRGMPVVTVCYHQCKFRMYDLLSHLAAALPSGVCVGRLSIELRHERVHSTMKVCDEHLPCILYCVLFHVNG